MEATRRTEAFSAVVNRGRTIPMVQSICSDLSELAMEQMRRMAQAIDEIAPRPGTMVYMFARRISQNGGALDPVVFSAIDVNTHLQVAQLYLTLTFGSAVDFLQFARENLPFRLLHVRTLAEEPFFTLTSSERYYEFSRIAAGQGMQHSFVTEPSREELFGFLSRLTFARRSPSSTNASPERELVRELMNFLFFHNNYRSLPSLIGKTPLQKLKRSDGFEHIHTFDPFAGLTKFK